MAKNTKAPTSRSKSVQTKKKITANKSPVYKKTTESDGAYFLKIVLFLIVSSLWLRVQTSSGSEIPLPVGAGVAVIYALHEHFQIDRKIELALILVAMFVSFWLPVGYYVIL